MTHLAPESLRAARAILKWSTRQLAEAAGLAPMTINAIENGRPYHEGTAEKIIATFSAHGVLILNGNEPGARLAPKS